MAFRKFVILRSGRQAAFRRALFRHPALVAAVLASLLSASALAQQQPTSLFSAQPLPPPAVAAPDQSAPASPPTAPPTAPIAPAPQPAPAAGRVFCDQNVTTQPADPVSVPDRYREFVGIFSDADWNPQTCAALIVENITDDGTATITYAFGPISAGSKITGGVLHGTGVIKDGALLFQNNDGSQYSFQPFYSDLAGKWTTPKGQTYEAVFKRAF